ncbi:MAG: hypothetical protein LBT09_00790 [Planctomycetaceae bacterium]|jgi:GTPase SAR1 family protein|nr:hypothetical protein [Planctomycetaceae bacterium]
MTRTPQIALIGTEGSGKTVLTTVLAKKLSQPTSNGLCMIPIGTKTAVHIEKVWEILQSGEWVESTRAGRPSALHWNLKIGNKQAEMKLIDSAGQDLRKLFGDEAYQDPNLPEQDKLLIEHIRSSSILIILINLRDFIAETDIGRKIESQMSLKAALEFVNKDNDKQVAVVLPQYDEYQAKIMQHYGSAKEFVRKELEYLYNSQSDNWKENLFPVAAVNDTEIRNDKDGRSRKVPKRNFRSAGLAPLIDWLGNALQKDLQDIEAERQTEEARQLEAERQRQKEEKRRQWEATKAKIAEFFKGVAVFVVILFALWIGGGIISGISERIQKERERINQLAATTPQPKFCEGEENRWYWEWTCNTGIFDCWEHRARANVAIYNNGYAGNIRVTFSLKGRKHATDTYFNANESKWVYVVIGDLPNHSGDRGYVELSVPDATKGNDGQWRYPQK